MGTSAENTPNTPTPRETAFNQAEFDEAYPLGIERHYWTLARNRIIAHTLRKFAPVPFAGLEIGCGRGVVLESFLAQGINCKGIELAPVQIPEHLRHAMWTGLAAEHLPAETRAGFNSILLLDVIEHLPKPEDFLRAILPAFPNVRFLLITVPARQEIWSNYDEHFGHFRRYDIPMLEQLATAIGAQIAICGYFFHALYSAARVQLRFQQKRQVQIKPPSPSASLLHQFLGNAFYTEHLLLPRRLKGSSLLCAMLLPAPE